MVKRTVGKKGLRRGRKSGKATTGRRIGVRLYRRDETQFGEVCKAEHWAESTAGRNLISEALETRRLRAIGRDARYAGVKQVQKEVVSEELSDAKTMLSQILSILRGQGTMSSEILAQSRVLSDALRLTLGSVLHVEEISEEHILRAILMRKVQSDNEATKEIQAGENHWQKQAAAMIERAKENVAPSDF